MRLTLTKETLAALSDTDLAVVAGGAQEIPTINQCPLTGMYPTLPVTVCVRETIATTL